MNIVVIEDDPITQTILNVLLSKLKHSVVFSSGDEKTFELLQKKPIDLIISDILLPNITGSDIVRYIKKTTLKKVPVLLISSLKAIDLKEISVSCGADGFLSKPLIKTELETKIREITQAIN